MWGQCYLYAGYTDQVTALLGLIFTISSGFLIQKYYAFKFTPWDIFIVLTFPIVYTLVFTYNSIDSINLNKFIFILLNPIYWSLLILASVLILKKKAIFKDAIFIYSFIVIFYSYVYYDIWNETRLTQLTDNFDTEINNHSENEKRDTVNSNINLFDYYFINHTLDTINISSEKDFILIETWNETCYPCILAMKEMPAFYNSIKHLVDVFYLYEHRKESVRSKFDKIFAFKPIEDPSKVLIDIEQRFYHDAKMNGYPYFLLFNSQGKLIYFSRGYIGKKALSSEIISHIKRRNPLQ